MNPALIAAMNFLMGSSSRNRKRKQTPKEPSKEFKQKVEQLSNMGLYEAIKSLEK